MIPNVHNVEVQNSVKLKMRIHILCSLLLPLVSLCTAINITVNTTYGPVIGTQVDDLNLFIGIPFAKPPIDELRFAAPEPPDSWTDPLELDVNSSAPCLQQWYSHSSEDCLYLNIWTPSDAEYMNTSYQVMVWIHGMFNSKTENISNLHY